MSAGGARLARGAGVALVLAAALGLRLAASGDAFTTGAFLPADGDSLYHLRRMQLVLQAWPRLPAVDPHLAWPAGGAIPWAAGFDALGAPVLALGDLLHPGGGALAVGLLHLGLALLVVLATIELTWRLAPASPARFPAALAAGLLVALVPQAVDTTRLGLIDHHVVEALALLALGRWALAAAPGEGEGRPWRARLGFEAAGAALSGGAVLAFTGSPLYVALAWPLLAAAVLAAPRPRLVGSGAPGLLLGALLAAAGTAPLVAGHGRPWAFGFPSWLQPVLLAVAALGVGLCLLAARLAPGRSAWRRLALAVGLSAAAAGLALLAPGLLAEGRAGLEGWLLRRDPWLARVDEFQPLWRGFNGATLREGYRYLGSPGLLLPLLAPAAWLALAPAGRRRAAGVTWLILAAFGLSLLQIRFGRVAAPWLGVAFGLALSGAGVALQGRPRLAAALPLGAAALLLLDPRTTSPLRRTADPIPDGAVEAALDLRGWPADPAAPGVLAPWDLGNHALVIAGRPVVANGFGSYPDPQAFQDAERAFLVAEPELLELLTARRVGVVFAGSANLFGRVRAAGAAIPFAGRGLNPAWLASAPAAPLLIAGSGVPALGVRHVEHLLARFASTRAVGGIDRTIPVLWGYERVAGARLAGAAPPGARVVLEIPLREHGREHTWRAWADAAADGGWAMTVPLPTGLATASVQTGPGRLVVPGRPAVPLDLPEEAVRSGRRVAAPPPPR